MNLIYLKCENVRTFKHNQSEILIINTEILISDTNKNIILFKTHPHAHARAHTHTHIH